MPLVTPILKGPLREWCNTLLVESAEAGVTVLARAIGPNPRDLARSVVSGGRNRIPLLPGVLLQPDDIVLVQQVDGAEQSEWTPDHLGVQVGPAPFDHDDLPPMSFKSRAWECGKRIWIKGAIPGAEVVLTHSGGLLGTARATESGDARATLTASMPSTGVTISGHQQAPPGFPALLGTPETVQATVDPLPVPFEAKLPTPFLGDPPPMGCGMSFMIAGIYDGADVTVLRRSDGSTETSTFDYERLNFMLQSPLSKQGDRLEITQDMVDCRRRRPSDPLEVEVGPARKPSTPVLIAPCANSADVFVTNLEGGCPVRLTYKGKVYRGRVPQSETAFVFRLPKLTANEPLIAVQERCGLNSDPGSTNVKGLNLNVGLIPDLIKPLFSCARAVRAHALPGAWLQVWGKTPAGPAPISNKVFATGDSVRIHITPYLNEGQVVWLSYLLCGGDTWRESPAHSVSPRPNLGPVNIIEPAIENAKEVKVDAIPGAAVNIYAMTGMPIRVEQIGSGFADPLDSRVGLIRLLSTKDLIYAEQWMCTERPGVGAMRNVLPSVRHISLLAAKSSLSKRNDPKPVVLHTANVTLRHNGVWQFTAFVENREPESDCSIDVQFKLSGLNPPFGLVLKADLSGKGSKAGLALQGVPSSASLADQRTFDGFKNPAYWEQVLGATGTFELIAVWNDFEGYAEEPDYEEKSDKDL